MSLFPLDTFPYEFPGREIKINFEMTEFTAICPFSDFPDFAVIRLKYVPNQLCIELKSLKLYINSFREIKVFHEHVINIILEDFVAACDPLKAEIEGDFHVRGNIKIFHEHVINIILEDFVAACDPLSVEIEGDFHVRGNIKTIVRASYAKP